MCVSPTPNLIRSYADTQVEMPRRERNHWTLLMSPLLGLPSFASSVKVLTMMRGPLGGEATLIVL